MSTISQQDQCGISLKPLHPSRRYDGYNNAACKALFGAISISPDLPFTRREFFTDGVQYADGMSISGVQQKLSLAVDDNNSLVYTRRNGQFILKPSPEAFPHAAENEHTAMTLARSIGFDTAHCGLVRFRDSDEFAYLTRRYDRSNKGPVHQESVLSAANKPSSAKYSLSYETCARVVDQVAGGRKAMVLEFIRRVMFSYYIGNTDAHAMNFSFLRPTHPEHDAAVRFAPIYDVLFTQVYKADSPLSFMALALLEDEDGDEYFTEQFEYLGFYSLADFVELGRRVGIPEKPIAGFASTLTDGQDLHIDLIRRSFMPEDMKDKAAGLIADRVRALRPR